MEEIIGEFQDEFDAATTPLKVRGDNRILVRGDVDVDDLNDLLDLDLPADLAKTIGGLVVGVLGKLPSVGEEIAALPVRIEKMEQNRGREASIPASAEQITRLQETQL